MKAVFNNRRNLAFGIILLILVVIVIEGISLVAINLLHNRIPIILKSEILHGQSQRIQHILDSHSTSRTMIDPVLGFVYRPNYRGDNDQINSRGLRSTREYSEVAGSGVLRIAAFGDSFVYCNEVGNEHSWPRLIEEHFPRLEVLNYGVGGYGTDQAYLRFTQEGVRLRPHVVIIGFAPVNIRRIVNVYRRFISAREYALTKPRFMLDERGNLLLLPNPIRSMTDYRRYLHSPEMIVELGRNDYWYDAAIYENPFYDLSATVRLVTKLGIQVYRRYFDGDRLVRAGVYNEASEAFKLQVAVIEAFAEAAEDSGMLSIVVIFPDKDSIVRDMNGKPKVYAPLIEKLRAKGIKVLDLTVAFRRLRSDGNVDDWFMKGGHYSPAGNTSVALWLGRWFEENVHMYRRANI